MQLTITQIHTKPQTITITMKEYNALKNKATKYENLSRTHSVHITAYNTKLTPEQRRQNAINAAKARWHKTQTHAHMDTPKA